MGIIKGSKWFSSHLDVLTKEQRTLFDPPTPPPNLLCMPLPPPLHMNGPLLPPLLHTAPPLRVPSISPLHPPSPPPLPWQRGQRPNGPGSHTRPVSQWPSFTARRFPPYCLRGQDKEEGGAQSGMRLPGRQGWLREGAKLEENCVFSEEGEQKCEDKAGRWLLGCRCSTATAHWPVWSTRRDIFRLPFFGGEHLTVCLNSLNQTRPRQNQTHTSVSENISRESSIVCILLPPPRRHQARCRPSAVHASSRQRQPWLQR